MVDLGPVAALAVWAIAGAVALLALLIAYAFTAVQIWWMVPATVVVWGALKLTLFKDGP